MTSRPAFPPKPPATTIVALWHQDRPVRVRHGILFVHHTLLHKLGQEYRLQWRPGSASERVRGHYDVLGRRVQ